MIPQLPLNIQTILVSISQFVAFEFIEVQDHYKKIFRFGEQSDLNQRFAEARFDGSNFIQLLGPIVIIIFSWLSFQILSSLVKKAVKKLKVRNVRINKYFNKKKHRNKVIYRFILEANIELTISCLIACFFTIENFKKGFSDTVSQILCFIMLTALIYLPIYVWKGSKIWQDRSHEKKVQSRFEGFFDELSIYSLYSLRYDIVFIIRRYLIVLTCVCTGFKTLQDLKFWYFI